MKSIVRILMIIIIVYVPVFKKEIDLCNFICHFINALDFFRMYELPVIEKGACLTRIIEV
jgi:hypothetical protein